MIREVHMGRIFINLYFRQTAAYKYNIIKWLDEIIGPIVSRLLDMTDDCLQRSFILETQII